MDMEPDRMTDCIETGLPAASIPSRAPAFCCRAIARGQLRIRDAGVGVDDLACEQGVREGEAGPCVTRSCRGERIAGRQVIGCAAAHDDIG
ncbi:hypothetical protein DIE19_32020 [Burkholderia sp. Bp9126]|nr:hypothetical protein DIE19_32020 [Burkholderia sp. Bp9126]